MRATSPESEGHILNETCLGVNANVSKLAGEFGLPKRLNHDVLLIVLKRTIALTFALTWVLVSAAPEQLKVRSCTSILIAGPVLVGLLTLCHGAEEDDNGGSHSLSINFEELGCDLRDDHLYRLKRFDPRDFFAHAEYLAHLVQRLIVQIKVRSLGFYIPNIFLFLSTESEEFPVLSFVGSCCLLPLCSSKNL